MFLAVESGKHLKEVIASAEDQGQDKSSNTIDKHLEDESNDVTDNHSEDALEARVLIDGKSEKVVGDIDSVVDRDENDSDKDNGLDGDETNTESDSTVDSSTREASTGDNVEDGNVTNSKDKTRSNSAEDDDKNEAKSEEDYSSSYEELSITENNKQNFDYSDNGSTENFDTLDNEEIFDSNENDSDDDNADSGYDEEDRDNTDASHKRRDSSTYRAKSNRHSAKRHKASRKLTKKDRVKKQNGRWDSLENDVELKFTDDEEIVKKRNDNLDSRERKKKSNTKLVKFEQVQVEDDHLDDIKASDVQYDKKKRGNKRKAKKHKNSLRKRAKPSIGEVSSNLEIVLPSAADRKSSGQRNNVKNNQKQETNDKNEEIIFESHELVENENGIYNEHYEDIIVEERVGEANKDKQNSTPSAVISKTGDDDSEGKKLAAFEEGLRLLEKKQNGKKDGIKIKTTLKTHKNSKTKENVNKESGVPENDDVVVNGEVTIRNKRKGSKAYARHRREVKNDQMVLKLLNAKPVSISDKTPLNAHLGVNIILPAFAKKSGHNKSVLTDNSTSSQLSHASVNGIHKTSHLAVATHVNAVVQLKNKPETSLTTDDISRHEISQIGSRPVDKKSDSNIANNVQTVYANNVYSIRARDTFLRSNYYSSQQLLLWSAMRNMSSQLFRFGFPTSVNMSILFPFQNNITGFNWMTVFQMEKFNSVTNPTEEYVTNKFWLYTMGILDHLKKELFSDMNYEPADVEQLV